MKKFASVAISSALLITTMLTPMNAYAETTFASAKDFIKDVLTVSALSIDSSTKESAIDTVSNKITVNGNEVLFNGNAIGYWFAEDSDTLYTDSAKTSTVIDNTTNGYTVDSALLSTLLTNVNDNITEVYEPTSTDWSKIIGKYDVTLGTTNIPMDCWIDSSYFDDNNYINISRLTGILCEYGADNIVLVFSYVVDKNGDLYLSPMESAGNISNYSGAVHKKAVHSYSEVGFPEKEFLCNGNTITKSKTWFTLDITKTDKYIAPVFTFYTNATLSDPEVGAIEDESFYIYRNITDPSITYTESLSEATKYGIVWYPISIETSGNTGSWSNSATKATEHNNFWTTFDASKTVVGNSALTKRITKISNLSSTDILIVSSNGWTINGTDIDEYIGSQTLTLAGGALDMGATAEVESRNFRVTLPTTLPMFVSRGGEVITATNASILNESNDVVTITDVNIATAANSDWTLVNTTPSQEKDAKEFSFTTSLNIGDQMAAGATLPFTYEVAFSPEIYQLETLDVATVTVTLDWAS